MTWLESFRGKAVLVTGASSGIGRGTALAFAAAGARMALVAHRRSVLEEVAELARAEGAEALVVPADVGDRAQRFAPSRSWSCVTVAANSLRGGHRAPSVSAARIHRAIVSAHGAAANGFPARPSPRPPARRARR